MDRDSVIALFLSLAMASVGGYTVYDHYQQKSENRQIEGIITYSGVFEDEDTSTLEIEYRYTVEGETYNSTKICPGAGEGCYGDPDETVEKYPEGERVTVYVDPNDPSKSYLIDEGHPYPQMIMTVVGGAFALLVVRSELT